MTIQKSMNHFWEGLKTGKFVEKTDEEIKQFMKENHFYGKAIIEPSKEEKAVLEKSIFSDLKTMFNHDSLRKLCEYKAVYVKKGGDPVFTNAPCFVLEGRESFEEEKSKFGTLSPEKKIKLLSNPDTWHKSRLLESDCSGTFRLYGMRELEDYGFDKKQFKEIIERTKKDTGKSLINILDVGGGMGVALKDIKKIDPKIITNNMTVDVEPVTYDLDNLYLCVGERFPLELKEKMDIILSNMAFVYMPGQSLTLENCLQSLSVGGSAFLNVEWGKQDYFIPNSPEKMMKQYARMKKLADEGFIELDVHSGGGRYKNHALTYKPKKDNNDYSKEFKEVYFPPAFVIMKKLKSLKD
jgi:hypothetical protein